MALIGNGSQSEFQALAFHAMLGINEIRLFDIDAKATAKLAANLKAFPAIKVIVAGSVAEAVKGAELPPMLLQPLVENAVKHGIEPLEEGGCIEIKAERSNQELVLTITDTGVGASSTLASSGTGVGIANVQSRLSALFGDDASLNLTENEPRGLIATLRVPIR